MRHGFHSEAWDEFLAAVAWHDARAERAGRELARAVAKTLEQVDQFPASAPPYARMPARFDVRKIGVSGWPYALVLATVGSNRLVIAIAHDKRKPGYWKRRVK